MNPRRYPPPVVAGGEANKLRARRSAWRLDRLSTVHSLGDRSDWASFVVCHGFSRGTANGDWAKLSPVANHPENYLAILIFTIAFFQGSWILAAASPVVDLASHAGTDVDSSERPGVANRREGLR